MATLARIEPIGTHVIALPAMATPAVSRTDFSELEWSVIRLARIDPLWTIRPAGPVRRFWNWLIGRGNPELANPKLEALRRGAVLSWHYGFTVTSEVIADFLSAGFSLAQYELMVTSITKAITSPGPEKSPEVFA